MKYRVVKRAGGWVVQERGPITVISPATNTSFVADMGWSEVARWPYHWLAALHLLWLRERAR